VRLQYFEKEHAELLSIDSCELIQSHFESQQDYDCGVALAYLTEAADQLLPDREPQDVFFRLLLMVLEEIRKTRKIWPALTYFDLWAVAHRRLHAGVWRAGSQRGVAGISRGNASETAAGLSPARVVKIDGQDLRRFLGRQMEMHIERNFKTRPMLDTLD